MDKGYFDFSEMTEQQEQLDFKNKVPCLHCKKPIPQEATMCLYCGEEVYFYKKPKWFIWSAIILIIVFIVFALGWF